MTTLLGAWDLPESVEVRPVTAGTNNTSYLIGDDFVLRIHRNRGFLDYEHAVLRALRGLSFAVPVPVPTVDGQSVVEGELDGQVVLASLARRIPGESDVGVTNTLMVGERVTGILDLEFVGPGYRAMDLATGMWSLKR